MMGRGPGKVPRKLKKKKKVVSSGSVIKHGSGSQPLCSLHRRKTPRGKVVILTCEIAAKRKYFLMQLAVVFLAACN